MVTKVKRKKLTASVRAVERATAVSANPEELLLAALERGDESFETGRYLVTYRENAFEEGVKSLKNEGVRVADARDFTDQAVVPQSLTGADALVFHEIGVALISGAAAAARGMSLQEGTASEGPVEAIEPEYFVFAQNRDYLRGFTRAANTIAGDLGVEPIDEKEAEEEGIAVLGATWGLVRCKVPPSTRSGLGIKVAVLDTGFDLHHPDFVGRSITTKTFVGQPVQDLHSHGTHCIGTACGPKTPPGTTPRYGIAYRSNIFAGKVLTNSGTSVGGSVLAGMNWAIANRCEVISMSLSGGTAVSTAYKNAGQAALNNGCLVVAAAGNHAGPTEAPANSPTIMAVASLDPSMKPSSFSNFGKIEIAAPGRDVFSSVPIPPRYGTKSGTSMATPHVAGCAALWAQTSPSLRGLTLWRRLVTSAKHLPLPSSRVGAGLVQAPA